MPNYKQRTTTKRSNLAEWSSDLKYTFALCCWVCGLESCLRATILGNSKARISAIIPYIVVLIINGIPYACLEIAVGQYSGKGAVGMWDCCPILKGIGYCSVFSIMLLKTLYNLTCSRILLYFLGSFALEVRWEQCDQPWNTELCLSMFSNYSTTTIARKKCRPVCESSGHQFYKHKVLNQDAQGVDRYIPNWECCIYSFVTAFITFIANYNGIRSLEKFLIFIVVIPTLQIIILVIVTLTDPGSFRGLKYIFDADIKHLGSIDMWSTLFEQVVLTLGFGLGGLSALGSQSPFRKPIYMRGVILPIFSFVITIFYSFFIYGLMGCLSFHADIEVDMVIKWPENLFFAKVPVSMIGFPGIQQVWLIMTFSNFYLMGLRHLFMMEATVLQSIYYAYPNTMEKPFIWSALSCGLTFVTCTVLFAPALIEFVENFPIILRRSTMLLANLQLLGLMWCYGITNFVNDIHFMLGIRPSLFWLICWGGTPLLFLVVQVISIMTHITLAYTKLTNTFSRMLSHLFVAAPLLATLGYGMMYRVKHRQLSWKEMFQPDPNWGPRHKSLRKSRQMFAAQSITKEYMYRQNILKDKSLNDESDYVGETEYVY